MYLKEESLSPKSKIKAWADEIQPQSDEIRVKSHQIVTETDLYMHTLNTFIALSFAYLPETFYFYLKESSIFLLNRAIMKSIHYLILITTLLLSSCQSNDKSNKLYEEGVSLELAQLRKQEIKDLKYDLSFSIPEQKQVPIEGEATIRFNVGHSQEIILDFRESADKIMEVFDTASHSAGTSSWRVNSAFRFGCSKHGKTVRARSGTNKV